MELIQSNAPGPEQDMKIETIGLASTMYEQGKPLAIRWVPGHRTNAGNETTDAYAKAAAGQRIPDKTAARQQKG